MFMWSNAVHDVATATAADECTGLTTVYEATNSGSYEATFDKAGTYHYACSVANHCDGGQRVTITVS